MRDFIGGEVAVDESAFALEVNAADEAPFGFCLDGTINHTCFLLVKKVILTSQRGKELKRNHTLYVG